MRIVSWNVNGLRACAGKGFYEAMAALDADVVCVQETKLQEKQFENGMPGYEAYLSSAEKPGYSGTCVFTRQTPMRVIYGLPGSEHNHEGRVITCEFGAYCLVNVYVPNSQRDLARLSYRMRWEDAFYDYVTALQRKKPVIVCGDLNVAHKEIDLKNPASNHLNAGFTDEERAKLSCLLAGGFADAFRETHPGLAGAYTWWSYIGRARERNAGWRIDYFLLSRALMKRVTGCAIHADVPGSDHCPISLDFTP